MPQPIKRLQEVTFNWFLGPAMGVYPEWDHWTIYVIAMHSLQVVPLIDYDLYQVRIGKTLACTADDGRIVCETKDICFFTPLYNLQPRTPT